MDLSSFPSSEAEFRGRFADEDHCREHLARLKWPEGFRCAHCAGDDFQDEIAFLGIEGPSCASPRATASASAAPTAGSP